MWVTIPSTQTNNDLCWLVGKVYGLIEVGGLVCYLRQAGKLYGFIFKT